jgi:hypothetical protein
LKCATHFKASGDILAISFRQCKQPGEALWADSEAIEPSKRISVAIDTGERGLNHNNQSLINNFKVNHPKHGIEVNDSEFRLDGKNCNIPLQLDLEPYAAVKRDFIHNDHSTNFRLKEYDDYIESLNLVKKSETHMKKEIAKLSKFEQDMERRWLSLGKAPPEQNIKVNAKQRLGIEEDFEEINISDDSDEYQGKMLVKY